MFLQIPEKRWKLKKTRFGRYEQNTGWKRLQFGHVGEFRLLGHTANPWPEVA
jgi:hypothetical protein